MFSSQSLKIPDIFTYLCARNQHLLLMSRLRFALFGNIYQAKKAAAVQQILDLLQQRGVDLALDEKFLHFVRDDLHIRVPDGVSTIDGDDFVADVALSVGGDGTFLETARRVGAKPMPILGVNIGRMGFLADFTPAELADALDAILCGDFQTEERCVLQLEYDHGSPEGYPYALNEVAVLKRDVSAMLSIQVSINGEYLTTYQADGIIINTPTGSTGYALSVGGPIMQPGSHTMGLVAVAPHSLTVRPVTLTDDAVISLRVKSRNHQFLVSLDGRSEKCYEDVCLTIRRAPYYIKVLKRPGQTFFHTLRHKLMWGQDVRN